MEAGEAEVQDPKRKLVDWNEYEGPLFTFRFGGAILYEFANYAQDANSRQQFPLSYGSGVRDARFLFKGRLKFKREVTYTVGLMYDGASDEFLFRETGVMIAVPRLLGYFFVGRTKEGFSLMKVMSGYSVWTPERSTINDATIPILADGIKWLGYAPKAHFLWNIGFYGDWISEDASFATADRQVSGRFAWLPVIENDGGSLVHLGVSARLSKPDNDSARLRSRPEAYLAPFFIDTGSFDATATKSIQGEAYYRPGPWLFGTEYFAQGLDAPQDGNPLFHGGEALVAWLMTGETRPYNTRGGFFGFVSPNQPVFAGGPGAWELVARVSYSDLNGGTRTGGTFWRFTPMANWYLSDQLRLEFTYGYGSLNRFGLVGKTQFFQMRVQFKL